MGALTVRYIVMDNSLDQIAAKCGAQLLAYRITPQGRPLIRNMCGKQSRKLGKEVCDATDSFERLRGEQVRPACRGLTKCFGAAED
jgi:hypothetical protein